MIIREFYKTREDGVNLYRTYSDKDMYIRQDQTGIEYEDAVDIETALYTYTETNVPIETDEEFSDSEFRAMIEGAL